MVGLKSYANGTKETWRNWQWNRITELLPGGYPGMPLCRQKQVTASAVAAYLCGPDDFDRECGLKRGFHNDNLIAIDMDNGICKKVRKNGGIAICGHLSHLLNQWPTNQQLDVVIIDLTCGLTNTSKRIARALCCCKALKPETVVSVNLLRGRDADGVVLTSRGGRVIQEWNKSICDDESFLTFDDNIELLSRGESNRHRGFAFTQLMRNLQHRIEARYQAIEAADATEMATRFIRNVPATKVLDKAKLSAMASAYGIFNSYRSGVQVFDSSIFYWYMQQSIGCMPQLSSEQGLTEAGGSAVLDTQSYVAKFANLRHQRN